MQNITDVGNAFIASVLGGFMTMFVAFLANASSSAAFANGPAYQNAALVPTEQLYISVIALATFHFLVLRIVGFAATIAGGTFADRGLGAGLYLLGTMAAAILFELLRISLVFLAVWAFYTGVAVPVANVAVPWTVEQVRTATITWPQPPWWERCQEGAAASIGQGIIWDTAFGAVFASSPSTAAWLTETLPSQLVDAVIGCFSGGKGFSPRKHPGWNEIKANGSSLGKCWRYGDFVYYLDTSRSHFRDHIEVFTRKGRYLGILQDALNGGEVINKLSKGDTKNRTRGFKRTCGI